MKRCSGDMEETLAKKRRKPAAYNTNPITGKSTFDPSLASNSHSAAPQAAEGVVNIEPDVHASYGNDIISQVPNDIWIMISNWCNSRTVLANPNPS